MFKKLIRSKAFRERVTWGVALVLIFPFLLFFHSSFVARHAGQGGIAGTLFGKPVPWEQFERQSRWARRQLEQESGRPPERVVNQLAWERLLVLAQAKRERVRTPDIEVARVIHQLPQFQADGRFQPDRYRRFLGALGASPQDFEGMIREDLVIQRLMERVKASVVVTEQELEDAYRAAHERARASLVVIEPTALVAAIAPKVTDDDVQAAYEAQRESLRVPERITFDYIGLTEAQARQQASPSQEQLARYYAAHPDEFTTAGEKSSTPFDQVQDNVRAKVSAQLAKQQLVNLAMDFEADAHGGRTLEELAATHQLTVQRFGPTPVGHLWATGAPEPAVMQAAFAQKMGELSRAIETDEGVYVLRVAQREPSRIPGLEEARPRVMARLVEQRAHEEARYAAQHLHATLQEALKNGTPFEQACQQLHVTPLAPAPFTRADAIEGLGTAPSVNAAVFGAAPGRLTQVVETPDRFVIALVHERLAAALSGLAAEREKLREETLRQKQQAHFTDWLTQLRERANLRSYVE